MELNSPSLTCPNTVTARRNPHRRARPTPSATAEKHTNHSQPSDVPSFPLNEILSIEIPENPSRQSSVTENLRVFLRIRPFVKQKVTEDQKLKSKGKNVWPQNPAKKKLEKEKSVKKKTSGNEVCVTVNDSHSVMLSPPAALQDSKRIKSEVYEGFSHVFCAEASQNEVYDKMVKPLVDEFLHGKSGMLAALGPTGSGKTHTVFGSPRDPGMVPLLLRQILKETEGTDLDSSRSLYISMFEICSEKGKGERLFDLSPDGTDISMQQSTIKGLQEVAISDIREAESFIARGMSRRATAMTNANSQSSRSQCIINIRSTAKKLGTDNHVQENSAVLTIVDLAGAEREKKTGNQGTRLLESNFINNTSMVFGLCLRSLFEHQKNPKKTLQKHFQNSMLTKYLRDYLEGKKRMALILTIRQGEEDYLDASYLLRQASPYMKIKFSSVEEPPYYPNKRQFQAQKEVKKPKKMKLNNIDVPEIEEGKKIFDEETLLNRPLKSDCDDLKERERSDQTMQKFAKAIWNVLKQHNKKLRAAEEEIQSLMERLKQEHKRCTDLEDELKRVKSCCTCPKNDLIVGVSLVDFGDDLESHSKALKCEADNFEASESAATPASHYSAVDCEKNIISESFGGCLSYTQQKSQPETEKFKSENFVEVDDHVGPLDLEIKEKALSPVSDYLEQHGSDTMEKVLSPDSDYLEEHKHNHHGSDTTHNQTNALSTSNYCGDNSDQKRYQAQYDHCTLESIENKDTESCMACNKKFTRQSKLNQLQIEEETAFCRECNGVETKERQTESRISGRSSNVETVVPRENSDADAKPDTSVKSSKVKNVVPRENNGANSKPNNSVKSSKVGKPKRRLLPASSILLKNMSAFDVEDEEKPKANRGGRKQPGNDIPRTQGSMALLRLLQRNLRP